MEQSIVEKGCGDRRDSGDSRVVHYRIAALCRHEGQPVYVYHDAGKLYDIESDHDSERYGIFRNDPVMKKEPGTVANIMVTGIFILAMTIVLLAFMDDMQLIQQKMEVDQIARRYILRMETVGYLQNSDQSELIAELTEWGVTEIDLGATTVSEVGYGGRIVLEIRGKLGGQYAFWEKRTSTAKY